MSCRRNGTAGPRIFDVSSWTNGTKGEEAEVGAGARGAAAADASRTARPSVSDPPCPAPKPALPPVVLFPILSLTLTADATGFTLRGSASDVLPSDTLLPPLPLRSPHPTWTPPGAPGGSPTWRDRRETRSLRRERSRPPARPEPSFSPSTVSPLPAPPPRKRPARPRLLPRRPGRARPSPRDQNRGPQGARGDVPSAGFVSQRPQRNDSLPRPQWSVALGEGPDVSALAPGPTPLPTPSPQRPSLFPRGMTQAPARTDLRPGSIPSLHLSTKKRLPGSETLGPEAPRDGGKGKRKALGPEGRRTNEGWGDKLAACSEGSRGEKGRWFF